MASNRKCYGRGMCLHIGTGCDFWASYGLCIGKPADAASYPNGDKLYVGANISGFSNPNIRTIFPDGHDKVHTFSSSYAYCWVSWNWGSSTVGTVTFELRDGSTVRASRSTQITIPAEPAKGHFGQASLGPEYQLHIWNFIYNILNVGESEGKFAIMWFDQNNVEIGRAPETGYVTVAAGAEANLEIYMARPTYAIDGRADLIRNTPEGDVVDATITVKDSGPAHGELSGMIPCPDGSEIATLMFSAITSEWEPTENVCDPCEGVICENACVGLDLYSQKCEGGVCVPDALIEANSTQCGYVPPCTSTLLGDVNGDGVVSIADATLLMNWVSFPNERETTYRLACPENADVMGTGEVTLADAIRLMKHVSNPDDPASAIPPLPPEPDCPIPTIEVYMSEMYYTPGIPDSPGTWHVRARSSAGGEGRTITSSTMEVHGPDGSVDKPLIGPYGDTELGWFGLNLSCYGMWVLKIKVDNDCGETTGWVEFEEEFVPPPPPPEPPECMLTDLDYIDCPDGTTLQINECVNGVKVPIVPIPVCPPTPPGPPEPLECVLTDADYIDCPDGTTLQINECVNGVKVPIIPIPICPPPQLCTEGEESAPLTCWDGSQIMTQVCVKDEFGGTAWLPSGEMCPMRAITRVMDMAIPTIMYEGQAVDIVVQVFCGAAASSGEPCTLQIDGVAVQTKNTLAGNVTFRWIAKGVGMHDVCAVIPINPNCAVPGSICKTITVSAYVEGIMEQIRAEKSVYESQLEYLRGLKKQLKARPTTGAIPGSIFVPPSLAGRIIEIGGMVRTVPPGGISIPVPPGANIVTVIGDAGERIGVPVYVNPGLTVPMPPLPGLPPLPGGF